MMENDKPVAVVSEVPIGVFNVYINSNSIIVKGDENDVRQLIEDCLA